MPFGKYQNWDVSSVPTDYHVWLWTYVPLGDPKLKEAVRREILAAGAHDQIPRTAVNGTIRPPAFSYGFGWTPPPPLEQEAEAPSKRPSEKRSEAQAERQEARSEPRTEVVYRWLEGIPPEYKELVVQIIEKGYRQVALRKHPDRGGSIEEFNRLQEAIAWLRKQIR